VKKRNKLPDAVLLTAYEFYSQEMINLHVGQGLDIWWHNGHKQPTVEEYLQMCAYKTGTLARLSAKLSALIVGGTPQQIEAIGKFAESIGVAFQIQDDILNIAGEKFKGHEFGEDIHEGKKTLMVIHSLKNASAVEAKRLDDILNMHTTDEALIKEAIQIMKKNGSITYAQKIAKEIIAKAWAEVDSFLTPSEAKKKLKSFADYLIEREF